MAGKSVLAGDWEKQEGEVMIDDVVELLQRLVRIPSVNPENFPGTERTGEMGMAEFLREYLEGMGAEVVLEEVLPGRPNVIARFAPMDGRRRVLLGPHLDTVGVGGMTIEPFGGEERDGRIWGRGASDTKGPMAAMLWALGDWRERLAGMEVAVDFVGFMGEESSQWGSRDFVVRHAVEYEFAVVGEPTSMEVVHVTKGSLWATLQARGRAAHSSVPERGENAVLKMVRALGGLDRELGARLAGYVHPLLGGSTWNVGVVRGGSRPNIVPDLAEAEMDIRITPTLAADGGAMKHLREVLEGMDGAVEIVKFHENPPMETNPEHPMVLRLLACGEEMRLAGAPWFSDAAHLSRGGIPSVCVGPGSIEQAHTEDESIEIAALRRGAECFSRWIGGFAGE